MYAFLAISVELFFEESFCLCARFNTPPLPPRMDIRHSYTLDRLRRTCCQLPLLFSKLGMDTSFVPLVFLIIDFKFFFPCAT